MANQWCYSFLLNIRAVILIGFSFILSIDIDKIMDLSWLYLSNTIPNKYIAIRLKVVLVTSAVLSGPSVPCVLCCLEQAVVLSLNFSPLPAFHLPHVVFPFLKWGLSFSFGTMELLKARDNIDILRITWDT